MSLSRISALRQVLELEPSARAAFVDQACAENTALRDELHRLLALDAARHTLLDADIDQVAVALLAPSAGTDSDEASADPLHPDMMVGPWRMLRRLGSGGMGSVWLAKRADGAFVQHVALKMIRPGMDSTAVLTAFNRERDLVARLEHPGIAHLIDGGVDATGRPWYAMRHVEGETLDQWLLRNPSLKTRLMLFVSLCRTVAHAHRQLVVHRDIKPGNVIVQPDETPCLLDFGIAKILQREPSDSAATIDRFASPGYAAPEQLNGGQISTATDVYGLGAILFELLTTQRYGNLHHGGDTPTRASQAHAITEGPQTAIPAAQLRGDLDAIAMRALAPDPARRYGSAEALADDVQRHLDGRPVMARPDGFGYRLSRWIQRNRLASAGLLLAMFAMLAGTGISLWQAQRATEEAQRANTVKDYLISLFDAGRTNSGGTGMLEQRVIDMLDASAARLKQDLQDQPALRDEIYTVLVEIYDANNQGERSMALAQERVEMAENAFGHNNPRVVPALLMLAGVYLNHEQLGEVPALLARAGNLLDAAGDERSMSRALWLHYNGILAFHADMDRDVLPTDALDFFSRATRLMRTHYPDRDELLVSLLKMAEVASWGHQQDKALATIAEARKRTLQRHGASHFYLTQANLIQASIWIDYARPEDALTLLRQTHHDVLHFSGEHHNDVLVLRFHELRALLKLGRIDEAEALWRDVEAWRLRHHPDTAYMKDAVEELRTRIDRARADSTAP